MSYKGLSSCTAGKVILTAVGWLLFTFLAGPSLAQRDAEVHGTFDGDPMYTVLPPGGIPAITEPEFVTGTEARSQMSIEEPVLGMVIDGGARAYSLWQLDAHEIVNDTIAGTAVAATW
jgi:hypothetical protein